MSDVFFAAKDSATGFTNLEPSIGGQWLEPSEGGCTRRNPRLDHPAKRTSATPVDL
jgi:hypothetical protein